MGEAITIGIDIAKSVFQIHGVDADGTVVIRKRVGRAKVLEFFSGLPPCLVGMEACATAHQWARELKKYGHDTRLMPPTYVKAYVKRGKNDAADAAAICEAVTRPSMRFVPIRAFTEKTESRDSPAGTNRIQGLCWSGGQHGWRNRIRRICVGALLVRGKIDRKSV